MLLLSDFDQAAVNGRVYRRDFGALSLFVYTEKTAHARDWCPITRAARGIIFDRATGDIVARPFSKFFNLGEMPETQPEVLPTGSFLVEEKLDGSLGVIFHHEGKWQIATKGSLNSEQAQYAQKHLMPRYNFEEALPGFTILVEIIYPENRIVVDYGTSAELVLLTSINNETGEEGDPITRGVFADNLGMREVPVHCFNNILELPFRENHEGYVIRWTDCNTRVKVKSPRYVQVHRLLSYKSPRRILEAMQDGTYEEIREQLPHEIAGDFDDIAASLRMSIRQITDQAQREFSRLSHLAENRKQFAIAAQQSDASIRPMLFSLLDGKSIESHAYTVVKRSLVETV